MHLKGLLACSAMTGECLCQNKKEINILRHKWIKLEGKNMIFTALWSDYNQLRENNTQNTKPIKLAFQRF